jgi:flagellar hook-associated protein 2
MTTAGSSIISALGAGSGVDFTKLAQDISAASFAAQRDQLTARRTTLEAQISAAGQLRRSVNELASALGDRIRNGDLAPRGTLANAAVATVNVSPGASPRGSFALEVTQLASGQTLLSRPFASRDALVGEGTLTLRFGTAGASSFTPDVARAPIEITLTETDTLASVAARITQASGGSVQAYVATGTGGAQLVLKGQEGAANGFVLEAALPPSAPPDPDPAPPLAAGDPRYLAWTPAEGDTLRTGTARDAAFRLDGVAMTSPTNRVTGLPGGFGLTLTGTNAGAPTALTFAGNSTAISAVMTDLVAALNDIVGQLNDLAAPVGGELGNDPGARELRRDLAALAGQVLMPSAPDGAPRTLGELGVALNRDGTFRLDSARLGRTLETSPEAAAAMFTTGVTGVFAAIDRLARETGFAADPGSLGGSQRRLQRQLQASDDRLARIAEQQEALRERLTREFTASERRVAASQSTLAFIRQQVDIWSARER